MTIAELDRRLHELVSLYWSDCEPTTRDALVRFGELAAFAGYSMAIGDAQKKQERMAKWAQRAEAVEERRRKK